MLKRILLATTLLGAAPLASFGAFAAGILTPPLAPATATQLGGVEASARISVSPTGVLDIAANGATTGQVLSFNGSNWAPIAPGAYSLPQATGTTLGGITVSTGLSATSGALSVLYGTAANTAAQGNDSRIVNAVQSVAGLTGNTAPSVAQIQAALGLGSAAYQPSSGFDAAGQAALRLLTSNNLSELPNPATARTNLGLGTAATQPASAFDAAGAATTVSNTLNTRAPAASLTAAPVLKFGSGTASATFGTAALRYAQVGPEVSFVLDLEWTSLTAGSGAVTITGLPTGALASGGSGEFPVAGYGITASGGFYATINASGAIVLTQNGPGAPSGDTALDASALAATGGLLITGRYFAN